MKISQFVHWRLAANGKTKQNKERKKKHMIFHLYSRITHQNWLSYLFSLFFKYRTNFTSLTKINLSFIYILTGKAYLKATS